MFTPQVFVQISEIYIYTLAQETFDFNCDCRCRAKLCEVLC